MKTARFAEIARSLGIKPKLIFDIGSFDGSQAFELKEAFPEACVMAIEADPYNIGKCLDARNRSGKRFEVINAALVPLRAGVGLTIFNRAIGTNDQCGSRLVPNGRFPEPMPFEQIVVPAITASYLTRRFGTPELLWMDIQGSERDYFLDSVRAELPQLVWMEVAYQPYYHDQPLRDDVIRTMGDLGYCPLYEGEGIRTWFGDICFELR